MNRQFPQADEPVPPFDQLHEGNPEESIHLDLHETNTNEGSEFLNDTIRMEDMGSTNTGIAEDEIALYVSEPFITEPDIE